VFIFGFANVRNAHKELLGFEVNFVDGDNLFITHEDVNKLLTVNVEKHKMLTKENLFLKVLEDAVQKNEMIKKAEVYSTVNGKIKALIEQKKPIARVLVNQDQYYLDDQAQKMPLSKNYSARVPLVKGIMSQKDSNLVFNFCTKVLKDEFFKKMIVGITVKNNELVLNTRLNGPIIEFGNLDKYKEKIIKLKHFYQKVTKDKTLNKYSKINVKYHKQIVCTKV
jgi:cell division protein FtsQ